MKNPILILIILFFGLSIYLVQLTVPLYVATGFLIALAILWLAFTIKQKTIPASGILSLFLTISTFLIFETTLQSLPDGYLPKEAEHAPLLIPPDKGNAVYQKNGFRGKRPCQNCPDNNIRIVTMGGSSTYGIPLYYSEDTYSAALQRLLDERRPGENYEVLNGGIAGYGIMQIIDSLKQEVLKFKPDVVTLCAWFNDSSSLPSWYGYATKSDKESYEFIKLLTAVEKIPGFKTIYKSRSFGFVRYYMLKTLSYFNTVSTEDSKAKKKKTPYRARMSVEEFEWGLEELIKLSSEHKFLPVFIYEAVNRSPAPEKLTEGKEYYDVIDKIARKYEVPIVDTLSDFAERRNEWFFYDLIHPNKPGHDLVAESIYKTIFVKPLIQRAKDFLSAKGVEFGKPAMQKEYFFQIESKALVTRTISFKASTRASSSSKKLTLSINSQKVKEFDNIKDSPQEFSFEIPQEFLALPIVNLKFTLEAESPGMQIGQTGIRSRAHISATSGGKDYGWQQEIKVDGMSYASNYDGYSVVVLGSQSGKVKHSTKFNFLDKSSDTESLYKHMASLTEHYENGSAPIVIVTLKTDGYVNTDQKMLSEAFRMIGGSGKTPGQFESFLLIGGPGATPGSGIEFTGNKLLHHEVGKKSDIAEKLFKITDFQYK